MERYRRRRDSNALRIKARGVLSRFSRILLLSGVPLLMTFLIPFFFYTFLISSAWGVVNDYPRTSARGGDLLLAIASKRRGLGSFFQREISGKVTRLTLPVCSKGTQCPPQVFNVVPNHGPARGGFSITISTTMMITRGPRNEKWDEIKEISARIGSGICGSPRVVWASPAMGVQTIVCKVPPGLGSGLAVAVAAGNSFRASSSSSSSLPAAAGGEAMPSYFSYDAPLVLRVEPSHGPRRGGTAIIIRGRNFGTHQSSPAVAIGAYGCKHATWVNDETIRCITAPGRGIHLPIHVKVCGCTTADGDAHNGSNSTASPLSSSSTTASSASSASSTSAAVFFSYDEDVVEAVSRSAVFRQQLSQRAFMHPPLVMHQAQLLLTLYEILSSSNTTVSAGSKRLSAVQVPPELSALLPAADFSERHRSCAVVGESSSSALLHSRRRVALHGDDIDGHDAVVRLRPPLSSHHHHRMQEHLGTKTTFVVFDQVAAEEILRKQNQEPQGFLRSNSGGGGGDDADDDVTAILWQRTAQETYIAMKHHFPASAILLLSPEVTDMATAAANTVAAWLQALSAPSSHEQSQSRSPQWQKKTKTKNTPDAGQGPPILTAPPKVDEGGKWSSLLYASVFALRVCDSVDVYGADYHQPQGGGFSNVDVGDHDGLEEDWERASMEYMTLRVLESVGFRIQLVNAMTSMEEEEEEAVDGGLLNSTGHQRSAQAIKYVSSTRASVLELPEAGRDASSSSSSSSSSSASASELLLLPNALVCTSGQCKRECSGHGALVKSTCVCDPIYGGEQCDEDLLRQQAPQLMEGLDLRYHGSITLHKGDVKGAVDGNSTGEMMFIPLPDGATRDKLSDDNDMYKVDETLFHLLPDSDLETRFSSCAIVGNSGAMLENRHGRDIDSHDMVYRFNQAPTRRFDEYVGRHTSMESLNGFWVKKLLDTERGWPWNWRSRETSVMLFEMFEPWAYVWKSRAQILDKDKWWREAYSKLRTRYPERKIHALSPAFIAWSYQMYRNLRRRFQRARLGHYEGEKPMSGFFAFLFCLQVCDEISMYGFQPYRDASLWNSTSGVSQGKYHYFDNAIPRPGSHSFDLARYIYQLVSEINMNVKIYD